MSITLLISFHYPGGLEGAILMFCGGISVIIQSPIEHENKRLSEEEKQKFKKITAKITVVCMSLSALFMWGEMEVVFICISLGILLAVVLQIPCVILKRKN